MSKVRFSSLVGQFIALQDSLVTDNWDLLATTLRAALELGTIPFSREYLIERRELIAEAQRWSSDQLQNEIENLPWYTREMHRLELMYWLSSAYLLALDGNIEFD